MPYLNYNFLVEIDDLVVAGFSEVTGLDIEIQKHEYHEGGVNAYVHQLAGPTVYPSNIVLTRGISDSTVLWEWFQNVAKGDVVRRDGAIILLDVQGAEKWRWDFSAAYPVKWRGPQLKALGSEVAIESLELSHRGIFQSGSFQSGRSLF